MTDIGFFLLGQIIVPPNCFPVVFLTGIAADHIDGGIGGFCLLQFAVRDGDLVNQNGLAAPHLVQEVQGLILFIGFLTCFGKPGQPAFGGQLQPGIDKALLHRDLIGRKYIAAAGAADYRIHRACAEQGDLFRLQGQNPFVL